MVDQGRIELPTLGFSSMASEFYNLLKILQLIEIIYFIIVIYILVLGSFSRFWIDFLTQILTQKTLERSPLISLILEKKTDDEVTSVLNWVWNRVCIQELERIFRGNEGRRYGEIN
jgi:hypothetical protein